MMDAASFKEIITNKIMEEAQEKVNDFTENVKNTLQYQITCLIGEIKMSKDTFYNKYKSPSGDVAIVENGNFSLSTVDASVDGKMINKKINVSIPDDVSDEMKEAINLALANTKKLIA